MPSRDSRYPLEAAQSVRDRDRDRAEAALAEALGECAGACELRERAQEKLGKFRHEERARIDREGAEQIARASDLQNRERYRERMKGEESKLRAALAHAHAAEERAKGAVDRAREALGRAHADSEVIERHRERWTRARDRERERQAENEAEDQRPR